MQGVSSLSSLPCSGSSRGVGNVGMIYSMSKKKKTHSSSQGPESSPPRITSNVKQNLQFLKLWKEYRERKSSTPKPSTSYRRKKLENEELPEDTENYRDPTMTLYYTNQGLDIAVPVLLVDGYNVCGYWAKLKKHFLSGRLDIARQKLIDELVTFSMLREVKVVVVFDAMMSGLPTHKDKFACVDIVYSGESCADSWIEKEFIARRANNFNICSIIAQEDIVPGYVFRVRILVSKYSNDWNKNGQMVYFYQVAALKEDGCPKVWVVTSDHCQQHAAYGAGAYIWSSKALVSEIRTSNKEVEMMLQEHRSTSFQGRLLKHNLDSEVVDALKDLRNKLSDNENGS